MEDGLYQLVRSERGHITPSAELTYATRGIGLYYNGIGPSGATSEFIAKFSSAYAETRYFEFGFTWFPSHFSTPTGIEVYMEYYSINGFFWNASYYPAPQWDGDFPHEHTQCTITPFLVVNGVRYYGTSTDFGADNPAGHASDPPADDLLLTKKTLNYRWSTNPENSAAWSVDDYPNISFGVRFVAPSAGSVFGTALIHKLYSNIYYQDTSEVIGTFEYRKLSPINNTTVLTQYSQTPIKADDLRFTFSDLIPLRSEIALVKDGMMVFRGLVWSVNEKSPESVGILAKSQQILLDYRLVGQDFILDDDTILVSELLSDDALVYPDSSPESVETEIESNVYLTKYYWNVSVGLFNFLNSWRGQFRTCNLPGGQAILDDHSVDTHLRPGTNDLDAYEIDIVPDLNGIASKIFSDMFLKFGQEVRYRYEWDGNVYQDAAIEIADGSEDAPLYEFVHGDNATITMKIPSAPNISAAIGTGNNPKVSSSWKARRGWHSRVFSSQRIADDLRDYLDAQIDVDDTTYDIILSSEVWALRPGDYIAVKPKDYSLTSVRVRQITTGKGKTQILAGKRLLSLNEQFGIWRDAKYAGHQYEEIKETEIASSDDLSISKDFTIISGDLVDGWQCVASIQWDFTMRNVVYIDDNGQEGIDTWATIDSNTSPFPPEAYIQIAGDTYNAYGSHEYEFYITRNIEAHGIEPYGENDVEVLTTGKFKWRKNGGSWSSEIEGYDVWHATSEFNADLGDGLYGRVIFSLVPPGDPWTSSKTSNIQDKSASAWACETIDLSLTEKVLILKIDGEVIPPGRYLAKGDSSSMEVDITEFCDAAGTYALAAELIGGQDRSANPSYYHSLSGSIKQSKRYVPMVV
ncbi:hypothetical protein M0R72_12320 [Candidatus Pacearchaeota archaeon]|jgi:hypothetical protein|nr:hypothetical protein [Candidatus Pacearchaeota archaeon]